MPRLYLDANATEPMRPEAIAAMAEAMALPGNPSSVHAEGRAARRILEEAREAIAARFGGRGRDVVFTSGGTEANALAIRGLAAGRRVLVGAYGSLGGGLDLVDDLYLALRVQAAEYFFSNGSSDLGRPLGGIIALGYRLR